MGRSKDLATRVGIDDNANATAITIDSSENVGVGLTAPTAPLTIKSPTNAEAIHVVGRSDDIGQMKFFEADHTTILATLEARNSFVNFGSQASIPTKFMTSGSERMIIDASGRVTMPSQPCFLVNGNQGGWQTVSAGGTSTVAFHQEQFDQGNCFNNSTMRFVAPVSGKYLLHFSAYVRLETQDDDTNHAYTRITRNGSIYAETHYVYGYQNNGDADQQATLTVIMDMSANDYAMAALNAASGSASFYQPGCQFMGYLVA